MTIKFSGYDFYGPFPLKRIDSLINEQSGVYVILTEGGDPFKVIDVGMSDNVRKRIKTHDRKNCWNEEMVVGIAVAALYISNEEDRNLIERTIRNQYLPACGKE